MTFFDKKEDVMKIQLTPYGRYLLSIGKLVPHSYKFFDEDVVYDSTAMGLPEPEQNSNHVRITEETPKRISNPNITGVESNLRYFESQNIMIKNIKIPSTDDIVSNNNESIGTNSNINNFSPHFKVEMYRGDFSAADVKNYYSSNNVGYSPIPQVPINMFLSASIVKSDSPNYSVEEGELSFNSIEFADGTKFKVHYPEPIIRISEINSFDETDNFTITAFKIETVNGVTTFKKLKFPMQNKLIVNDLLVGEPESPIASDAMLFAGMEEEEEADANALDRIEFLDTQDRSHEKLNYYLDVIYDREISDTDICKTIGELEIRNIFLDEKLPCPEDMEEFDINIYDSDVEDVDIEDCE